MFDIDPLYAWIAAEPSLLADGELAGAGDDHLDRFILTDPTIQRLEDFLVAECLRRGAGQTSLPQSIDLLMIAVLAVVYASIAQGRTDAMTALVGVAGAGVGFFLRAKVQAPAP